MTEAGAPPGLQTALAAVDALRAAGISGRNPVRFRYLETLAQRLPEQAQDVQTLLVTTLLTAVADYERCHAHPVAAMVRARPATLPRRGLDALKTLNRQTPGTTPGGASSSGHAAPPAAELKSVQQLKQAWGRMKVQDQVQQALKQGPANAGPLNSHRLVVRTLDLMQGLSPAYLHHFMGHLETLLQLESLTPPAPAKPSKAGKAAKPAGRKSSPRK
jgi:hypothetical protein